MTTEKYVILKDLSRRSLHAVNASATAGALSKAMPTGFEAIPVPVIETKKMDASTAKEMARNDSTVVGIARSFPTRLIGSVESTNPMATGDSWGIRAVRADTSIATGAGITVAVLDTGIDAAHSAFVGVTLDQKDFSGSGNGDVQGHGTHCAGTIFGRDVAGNRIGVARGVTKAMIGKVLNNDGSGESDMIFQGIQWAVMGGAKVISMSLGFDFAGMVARLIDEQDWPPEFATSVALEAYRAHLRMFDALMAQVRAAGPFGKEAVLVAAAGNESQRDRNPNFEIGVSIPAAAEGIVSVGALQQTAGMMLKIADFSNTGPVVSAPGFGITSARAGGGLIDLSGTSMAAPHVAGCAALWWERLAALGVPQTAGNVVARMRASCAIDRIVAGTDIEDRGDGLVQAPQ